MHAASISQSASAADSGQSRPFDSTQTVRSLRGEEFAQRRDEQHRSLWDNEAPCMPFADIQSPEEAALADLFEFVRQNDLNPIVMPPPPCSPALYKSETRFAPSNYFEFDPPPSSSVSACAPNGCATNFRPVRHDDFPQRDPYAPAEHETCMRISSYEELMRTTSYKLLQAHAGDFSEIPVSESRRVEVCLQAVVTSADQAAARRRPETTDLTTLRCEAYLSVSRRTSASMNHDNFKKARATTSSRSAGHLDRHYICDDMKQALFCLWDKAVAKKNASLMLEVVRRKLRSRYS